jgi:hypothetical protein
MALGDLNTIGDVTRLLQDLLEEESLDVTLHSPASLPTTNNGGEGFAAVNLYLYQVTENPHAKNQPWITRPEGVREYPPLALNLFYLLTPYASDPLSAHQVLSHAMLKLYLSSTLLPAALPDSLRLSVERLTVNLCQMTLEELTRIWNALQTPYRLSVGYQVRIVLIESQRVAPARRVLTATTLYQPQ